MGELKKLMEKGKIKYIGLSKPSIDTIKRAHIVPSLLYKWSIYSKLVKSKMKLSHFAYTYVSINNDLQYSAAEKIEHKYLKLLPEPNAKIHILRHHYRARQTTKEVVEFSRTKD
ncbi:hypothetical protein J1N35_019350 [Gossypium stocksii]|uniref:NADP-dependent oxidoreductase domain-containing protein n=1 Tax=Gossypium stocksii TaxID=47602 RepID=A0A9D4A7J1_9ROSI|nr:hypothetical protein J1N35_019350 [Gossypium stocksii]